MSMVYLAIRQTPDYPYREIEQGVRACGDKVSWQYPSDSKPLLDSYFVTWNNYGLSGKKALQYKGLGAKHVVFENGYIPCVGKSSKTYSVNLDTHVPNLMLVKNNYARLKTLDIKFQAYRNSGEYILICGQRGGSYSSLAMPNDWPNDVITKIKKITNLPIIYKPHPHRERLPRDTPICRDSLESLFPLAKVCVVYTSNAATLALAAGVPVIYQGPRILCKQLASRELRDVKDPLYTKNMLDIIPELRLDMFGRLSFCQWSLAEIENGIAWSYIKEITC